MMTLNASPTSFNERVDERAARLTEVVARRIREAMGEMTQGALAERLGYASGSTVSGHLNGRANLTLKTVVRYAVALDAEIVVVPDVKRPKKRRRRRPGRERRVSNQRQALNDINPVKRKLHRLLTDLTARMGQIIQADDELSQRELARRMDRDEAYVSRALAGGVNFTLKTIAAFEEALGESVLRVEGQEKRVPSSPYQTDSQFVQIAFSSDGGYCSDPAGVVTNAMDDYAQKQNQPGPVEESPVAA